MSSAKISSYLYDLPDSKIAEYPLPERAKSALLVYRDKQITDTIFSDIYKFVESDTLMFFNNTKVMKARLWFRKESGALIQVFCLKPVWPVTEISQAYGQTHKVVWECLVGNAKKWKEGPLYLNFYISGKKDTLTARLISKQEGAYHIAFEWHNDALTFADILEHLGKIPLPPYIKREAESLDNERYQTVYASVSGSVAAPTAGLHFTPEVLSTIKENCKGIDFYDLNLQVGTGTFKPVEDDIHKHVMHTESFSIATKTIEKLLDNCHSKNILAVGTTSLRTLESLFWIGVNIINNNTAPFNVSQFPYKEKLPLPSVKEALKSLHNYLKENKLVSVNASTSIMIMPGYSFKVVNQLLTNFHQPGSTLILLVAAFIGEDWEKIYKHALKNNYRFLSYGDVCFFKKTPKFANHLEPFL